MQQHTEILAQIKIQVQAILPNSELMLFGSRARNENSNDSDYDILVITENLMSVNIKRDFRTKIRKALLKINILSDILIESKNEINIKKKLPGHIIKNAIIEGVKI